MQISLIALFQLSIALSAPAAEPPDESKPERLTASNRTSDPLKASRTWERKHASHLLRRAGFGGTPEQVLYLRQLGRERAVDYLINYHEIDADLPEPDVSEYEPRRPRDVMAMSEEERKKTFAERRRDDRVLFENVVGWWVDMMVSSPRPLEEKLTLFWHGHLTSGYREVKSAHAMLKQNRLLRRHASGNFRTLLLDISEDPAMVLYLNTQQNRKGMPNENYARELLELFTMGTGNYTEQDIKEAARAFTGYTLDPQSGEVVFRPRLHDDGEKTFLGRTGPLEPADIIDIVLEQPVTAEFITRKMWRFFAYDDPEEDVIKALAAILRENQYEFKPMLRAMFMSDAFYSKRAMFTQIKSPVELLVGCMRSLEIPAMDTATLNIGLRLMGQSLMQPPNVKGWDGGEAWITASTLFNRYNVLGGVIVGNDNDQARRRRMRMIEARRATTGREGNFDDEDQGPRLQPAYDPLPAIRKFKLTTPERVVDHYVDRLLQRPLPRDRKQALIDAIRPSYVSKNPEAAQNIELIRGLAHLIVSMPEFQLE